MPKYVFEQSVILPADKSLTVPQLHALARVLCADLKRLIVLTHHAKCEVGHEPPFEHVTGDWLPPGENGVTKMSPESRSIDL